MKLRWIKTFRDKDKVFFEREYTLPEWGGKTFKQIVSLQFFDENSQKWVDVPLEKNNTGKDHENKGNS